jgi:acetyl-CoA C-acetyltransferase
MWTRPGRPPRRQMKGGHGSMTASRVAIVSSAQTELRPAWRNAQHIDLISAVVSEVFKGTGLGIDDVDFVFDSGSDVLDGRSISN